MTSTELKEFILKNEHIPFILEKLGCGSIAFHESKGFYSATQPDGDNKMGVVIFNNEYLGYVSYSRNITSNDKRDLFYLIEKIKGIKFSQVMKWTHELFGMKYSYNSQLDNKPSLIDPLNIFKKHTKGYYFKNVLDFSCFDESALCDFVDMIHIELFREGIIKRTINAFRLGYSYKWKRTIIPHRYWSTGEVMGYNARTSIENYKEFDIPKYYLTPGMRKEFNLYGLYENLEEIEKKGVLVIFESEKSVLKRHSRLDSTCVALSGKSLSQEQIRIIEGLNIREVVIALDKDVPIEEVWDMCESLHWKFKVTYIYDKHDLLGEKDSPADAENKIYDFLYRYRETYDEEKRKKYLKILERN